MIHGSQTVVPGPALAASASPENLSWPPRSSAGSNTPPSSPLQPQAFLPPPTLGKTTGISTRGASAATANPAATAGPGAGASSGSFIYCSRAPSARGRVCVYVCVCARARVPFQAWQRPEDERGGRGWGNQLQSQHILECFEPGRPPGRSPGGSQGEQRGEETRSIFSGSPVNSQNQQTCPHIQGMAETHHLSSAAGRGQRVRRQGQGSPAPAWGDMGRAVSGGRPSVAEALRPHASVICLH